MKTCSKCGETKSRDGFGRDRTCYDGLYPWCKECCRNRQKSYDFQPDPQLMVVTCSRCDKTKGVSEFNKNKRKKNGLHSWCKKCLSDYYRENQDDRLNYTREYRKQNPEKVSNANITWKRANPERMLRTTRIWRESNPERTLENYRRGTERRRARKKNLPYEDIDWREVGDRDGWICGICSEPVDPNEPTSNFRSGDGYNPKGPSLDHIIPYAHPDCPGHIWSNVQISHHRCNLQKHARVEEEDLIRLLEEVEADG